MRVTLPLRGYHGQFGAHPGQWRKKKWQEGSPIVVPKNVTFNDPRLQVAVEQSGKYVENPFWNPPWERPKEHPEWIPESDDPRFDRFRPKPPIEAHPLWKDNSAYTFDDDTKLTGRMEQAKILTKTVVVEGLTADVEDLIGAYTMANQDEIVRRHVLQGVAWDPTKEEMPQWFKEAPQHDPYKFVTREDQLRHWRALVPLGPSYQKQADNLLGNLLRLCDISNHHHSEKSEDAPDLTESIKNRHLLQNCEFQTVLSHLDGDLIHFSGKLHSVIYGDSPLTPPAGKDLVDETVQEGLPEMWPIKPTIDLLPKHIYDDVDTLTFRMGQVPTLSHPLIPHTLGISWGQWWERYATTSEHKHEAEDCLTRAFMTTFGAAVAQARLIHGGDVQGELRSPVVLQAIATNGFNFDFITFQLNTLDFSSSEGVKNIAWIDSGPHNNIREDWRPTTWTAFRGSQRPYVLKEFNPVVFEKILATYLNGAVKWAR